MKAKTLFLMLFASLLWTGCGSDDDPASEQELVKCKFNDMAEITPEFSREGGVTDLTFTATGPWKITNPANWITVEPMSGDAGEHTLTITVDPMSVTAEASERMGQIQIGEGLGAFYATITQHPIRVILSPLSYDLPAYPLTVSISLSVLTDYVITVSEDAQSWITTENIHPVLGDWGSLFFDIAPNNTGKMRKGTITVSCNKIRFPIEVHQSGDGDIRPILMEVYEALGGEHWKNNDNWGTDKPLNTWEGLQLDNTNYELIGFHMFQNNVSGQLPDCLGQLTTLKWLYFYDNEELTGTIPESLSQLTNLQNLYLFECGLEGEIPASLGNLKNLHTLILCGNQLSGKIPEELGNLSLWGTQLQNNNLEGGIPDSFANISNLGQFYVYGNRLDGKASPTISEWLKTVADPRVNPQQEGFSYEF